MSRLSRAVPWWESKQVWDGRAVGLVWVGRVVGLVWVDRAVGLVWADRVGGFVGVGSARPAQWVRKRALADTSAALSDREGVRLW